MMKYECTINIYKDNKHMNVSYNIKKIWKSVYAMKLETPKDHFFGFWYGDSDYQKLGPKQKLSTNEVADNTDINKQKWKMSVWTALLKQNLWNFVTFFCHQLLLDM